MLVTKSILPFILIAFIPLTIFSQQISRDAITSAGESGMIASNNISWSIGQVFVEKISSNEITFTQGFQQPFLKNSTSVFENFNSGKIDIYPNPIRDIFTVRSASSAKQEIQIFNVFGQRILSDEFRSEKIFTLNRLPSGSYFVQILLGGQIIHTSSIQKI